MKYKIKTKRDRVIFARGNLLGILIGMITMFIVLFFGVPLLTKFLNYLIRI